MTWCLALVYLDQLAANNGLQVPLFWDPTLDGTQVHFVKVEPDSSEWRLVKQRSEGALRNVCPSPLYHTMYVQGAGACAHVVLRMLVLVPVTCTPAFLRRHDVQGTSRANPACC